MTLLFRLLGRLPLSLMHAAGAFLGGLVYLLAPRERWRAASNLAFAFPAGVPPGLAWQSALAAGRSMAELPYLWTRSLDEVLARVLSVEGWEHVDAARARGDALIFLTPHIGSFEVVGQVCGAHFPMVCLYRPPKNTRLEPVMVAGRTRGHMSLAATDQAGVKKLLRTLRQREAIGLLPDQVPQSGEGIWAPFFSQPAYTMTLAARFVAQAKVTTLYIYARREAFGRYKVFVRPPAATWAASLEERVSQINRDLEKIVLTEPRQYFWAYNRYKAPHSKAANELAESGQASP